MNNFKPLAKTALMESYRMYRELLDEGTAADEVRENQFGEIAMKIDIACEDVVISALKQTGVSVQVISEEHGTFTIGKQPEYTAFIDGLDGSTVFKESGGKARNGTMFSLYRGTNPRFKDYIFGAATDHALKSGVLAYKNDGGVIKLDLETGKSTKTVSSGEASLSDKTRIYIDEGIKNYPSYPKHNEGYFYEPIKKDFKTQYSKSSAVYAHDLAVGSADLILEYGRKNNLEHMVTYPLAIESGGVFEYFDNGSVEDTKYTDYCQKNFGYPAVVIAATHALADETRSYIRKHQH